MRIRQTIAALTFALGWSSHAATFKYAPFDPRVPDSSEAVYISGPIEAGDLEKLRALIRPDVWRFKKSTVVLASNGGDVVEAMKIGDVIRSSYVSVFVNKNVGVCASACFLLYVSAVERGATYPALGVHRPYFGHEHFAGLSLVDAERKQIKLFDAFREFLTKREVPQDIQEGMFSLASNEIKWLTWKDIDRIGPRANWYDQLMVSRCGLDKQLERGLLEYGSKFAKASEAEDHLHTVAGCAYFLTAEDGEAALRKFVIGGRRRK